MKRKSSATLEARLWRWRFLYHLRRQLRQQGLDERLAGDVAEAARLIFNENLAQAPDRQGVAVVAINALVLASYREMIAAGIDGMISFETTRKSFRACWSRPTGFFVRLVMLFCSDPINLFRKFKLSSIFHGIFGKMFQFEDKNHKDGVELIIRRCSSNEFFLENKYPLLTLILCEWDHNWLIPIQESRHGVSVSRPYTMATGSGRCEFHIKKSNNGEEFSDVTVNAKNFRSKLT